ncbi:hypothetical protein ACLOJK_037866, partial [Asimina triloba]
MNEPAEPITPMLDSAVHHQQQRPFCTIRSSPPSSRSNGHDRSISGDAPFAHLAGDNSPSTASNA